MSESLTAQTRQTGVSLIEPSKLNYSRIYLDYVAGQVPAVDFYAGRDLGRTAKLLDGKSYDREALQSILKSQNEVYNASPETFENINRLGDSRTVCVFAGQQAGFIGGPMLTLTKALAVVKSAKLYSEQLGRPVVPVFWIAGDDHDFDEANHMFTLSRQGDICRHAYETRPDEPKPMSEVAFCDRDELTRVKKELVECLGQTDFTPGLLELIDRAYTPSDTFVTAFGRLMAGLTKGTGLVLFNPGDAEAKRVAASFFKKVVERQHEIHALLTERNAAVEAAGYSLQVEKRDDASHLFYHQEGRKAISRDGDWFVVGDISWSKDQLLAQIEQEPEMFSTDVMLRPVLQSYLFPVLAQKCGPAEIAYMAQLNPLFEVLDVPTPVHQARATFTIVEKRFEKMMTDYRIDFLDLTGDIEQVVNRVLAESFPPNLEADFNSLRETISRQFDKIRAEALSFDNQLSKYSEQVQGKLDFTLKQFEEKVWAAHKKQNQQTRERIYRLHNALFTNRGLQERTLNIAYFIAKYGFDIIGFVFDRFDAETPAHQLISLEEYQH